MTATIRDVTKVGDVVDAPEEASSASELTLQGVSFSYKDPEAVMAEARTAALANAKVRAEQYADGGRRRARRRAADRRGRAWRRRWCSASWPPAAPAADSAKVAVEPGSQDLAADVSVVYAMS